MSKLDPIERADYVSAACVMVRRSDFFELGGFDLRYDPAYYEDSDLCLRLAALGKITVVVRDADVVHIENATTSDPANKKIASNIVERHKKIFLSRWSDWLEDRDPVHLPKINRTPSAQIEEALESRWNDMTVHSVYTPYPLTHGGGERYLLGAALALSQDKPVSVVTPDEYSTLRLNTLMYELGFAPGRLFTEIERSWMKRDVDAFVLMGNELLPFRKGRGEKRLYHCQFPFPQDLVQSDFSERSLNLSQYDGVVVNSEFTRDAYWRQAETMGVAPPEIHIIHPPVALIDMTVRPQKEPIILSIGRFHPDGHSKRQDVILEGYLDAIKREPRLKSWKLVLCGMVPNEKNAINYYNKLTDAAKDANVELVLAPSREKLVNYLKRASIFASATGYGVKNLADEHMCEHFGITVVEAASTGCIPVVYERGGPAAIIKKLGAGLTFNSISSLSRALIQASEMADSTPLSRSIEANSSFYSEEHFLQAWRDLANDGAPASAALQPAHN